MIEPYTYDANKKHAVVQVQNTGNLIQGAASLTYNAFNKVATVVQGTNTLTITYGPDRQRTKTVLVNGSNTTTTLYADNYEQRTVNGTTTTYHYVASPDGLAAVYVKNGSTATAYYIETDHLGSIVRAYDYIGNIKFSAAYDAWGNQTVSTNAIGLTRGYTGHEHWNQFGLIDMNGRFYDPLIGRFLSPDPYIQSPDNPQNFNRYSYCLNNPLKYVDPSGYQFDAVGRHGNGDEYESSSSGGSWSDQYIAYGYSSITGNWWGISSNGTITVYAYAPGSTYASYSSSSNHTGVQTNYSHPYSQGTNASSSSYYGSDGSYYRSGGSYYGYGHSGGGGYSSSNSNARFTPKPRTIRIVSNRSNGNAQIAATGTTAATNIANIASAGAQTSIFNARHLSDAQKLKYGVNALKGISKGATAVGSATTYGFAIYEWLNGQANTHTIVDVGICTIGLVGIGFATFIGAPVLAIGTVVFGTVYGISSAAGLGTTIDKASDNWGHKLIYGDEKDN